LIHPEYPKLKHNEEYDASYTSIPPLSTRPPWEEDSSDEESEDEVEHPFPGELGLTPNMDASFEWEAPDLQEGGEWCEAWLDKIRTITERWYYQYLVMIDARRLLASHRLNYTYQGGHRLEILLLEFPPEHWEYLWFGGSMNFMETPVPVLEGNGNMTEIQLTIAVAFMT
jgi:hypothetical protein